VQQPSSRREDVEARISRWFAEQHRKDNAVIERFLSVVATIQRQPSFLDWAESRVTASMQTLSDYNRRSPDQQLQDLNVAWDRIKLLQKHNDQQEHKITELHSTVRFERLKRWLTTSALIVAWEVIKYLMHTPR
jgi:hypothetical protein